MGFFYISAPYLYNSREGTLKQIREVILQKKFADGKEVTFQRAKFKLANLDTLMFCNDKILKLENGVQSFLKKIDKQYLDMQEKASHEWYVRSGDKEISVKKYYNEFKWNDSKYPRNYPIPKLVELFELKLNTVENELRAKTNSYNETKVLLNQNTQKQGNYNVKDLNDLLVEPIVNKKDFIQTKFVSTVVVIVPTLSIEEFKSGYEMYTDNVIPYSAKQLKIPEKDGLTIWVVSIFNVKLDEAIEEQNDDDHAPSHKKQPKKEKRNLTPIQEFIEKARQKLKLTVREFNFESGLSETRKKKKEGLQSKLKAQTKAVAQICLAYFSEIYELYIHSKMMRLVIETNMRFGSDPTVIYCIECIPGKQKTVQGLLIQTFGDKQSEGLYGTKDQIDDGEDFFPFIYVPGISF